MKFIKTLLSWLSLVCLLTGMGIIGYFYLTNKQFITFLKTQLASAEFGITFRNMLIGAGLILLSLILFIFALKAGSMARRNQKEKIAQLNARSEEEKRLAKEEVRIAKEEALEAKKEAERLKEEYLAQKNNNDENEL